MTQAACALILRVSTWGLAWRTVKDLKRITEAQAGNITNLKSSSRNDRDCDEKDFLAEIHDWEILQLWALYAFHILYTSCGVEWFVSFLPLYYYVKMIWLVITFLIPNTKFANFWFELALVPMMQKVHELLNLDWKGILLEEVIMLPWRILDLFLLPGLLMSDEEALRVELLRQCQLEQAAKMNKNIHGVVRLSVSQHQDGSCDSSDTRMDMTDTPTTKMDLADIPPTRTVMADTATRMDMDRHKIPTSATPSTSTRTSISTGKKAKATTTHPSTEHPDDTALPRVSSSSSNHDDDDDDDDGSCSRTLFTSPIARSRVAVSSLHLRKFSHDHTPPNAIAFRTRSKAAAAIRPTIPGSRNSIETIVSHKRRQPTAIPTASVRSKTKRPPSVAFKSTKASILSQAAAAASDPMSGSVSGSVSPHGTSISGTSSSNSPKARTTRQPPMRPKPERSFRARAKQPSQEDDLISISTRRSMGSTVRKFITGDDNIRIRDFLFDLDLPSMPSPTRTALDGRLSLDHDKNVSVRSTVKKRPTTEKNSTRRLQQSSRPTNVVVVTGKNKKRSTIHVDDHVRRKGKK